jgi:hypothetical protein
MKKVYRLALVMIIVIITITTLSSGVTKKSSRDGNYNDLVEQLYQKEVKQNTTLEDIEDGIEVFYEKKRETLEKYTIFSTYNNRYYADAKAIANLIEDAAFKQRAIDAINKSMTNYNTKMTDWEATIATLNSNEKQLNDLHHLLKIAVTTSVIETYQTKELPNIAPAKDTNTELLKIIQQIKTITK